MFAVEFMHELVSHSQMLYAVLKCNKQQQKTLCAALSHFLSMLLNGCAIATLAEWCGDCLPSAIDNNFCTE